MKINYEKSIEKNDNEPAVNVVVGYLLLNENIPATVEEIIDFYDKGNGISYPATLPHFDTKWGNWLPGDDGEEGFISKDDWENWKKYIPSVIDGLTEEQILLENEGKYIINEEVENLPTYEQLVEDVNEYYANIEEWDYDPY